MFTMHHEVSWGEGEEEIEMLGDRFFVPISDENIADDVVSDDDLSDTIFCTFAAKSVVFLDLQSRIRDYKSRRTSYHKTLHSSFRYFYDLDILDLVKLYEFFYCFGISGVYDDLLFSALFPEKSEKFIDMRDRRDIDSK